MKTALFSACYLDGLDGSNSDRCERTMKWLIYYERIKEHLGFQDIWLADNSSDYENIASLGVNLVEEGDPVRYGTRASLYRYKQNLDRGPGPNGYPFCWRALYFYRKLIEAGYDKIICIDTDSFVLTKKLAHHIRASETGWESLWCPSCNFPETNCTIMNRDAFPLLYSYTSNPDFNSHNGKMMEVSLPFTKVNKDFKADRYGHNWIPQDESMHFYSQCPVNFPMKFEL